MITTAAAIAALQTGYRKNFQDAFTALSTAADYTRIATVIPSSTKMETYGWLGRFPKMREWVGARVVKDMDTTAYVLTNKSWESTVGVARTDIEDDTYGTYAPLMGEMGHGAAELPNDLCFSMLKAGRSTLCFDGQNFFDIDHPGFTDTGAATTVSNVDFDAATPTAPVWYLMDVSRPLKPLIYQQRQAARFVSKTDPASSDHVFTNNEFLFGADARAVAGFGLWQLAFASNKPLTEANLNAAIQRMQEIKASTGRPLGVKPNLLVVGPKNRAAAIAVVKAQFGEGGKSNPNYQAVEVLDTPWVE
jgi:phage major head subunit gpT-like protein